MVVLFIYDCCFKFAIQWNCFGLFSYVCAVMHVALTEAGMTPSSIDSRSPSLPYSHSHTSSPDFDTEPKGGVSFTTCITV